jgi:hypothetical protein
MPTAAFALLFVAGLGAVPGPPASDPSDAWLRQIKDLAHQVQQSDLIVVGTLRITATRDGHRGFIRISEVLYGKVATKEIPFISPPLHLSEGIERIWFLTTEGAQAGKTWYLQSVGAAEDDRDAVRWLIGKIKNSKPER